jgi:hypothetical protein
MIPSALPAADGGAGHVAALVVEKAGQDPAGIPAVTEQTVRQVSPPCARRLVHDELAGRPRVEQ